MPYRHLIQLTHVDSFLSASYEKNQFDMTDHDPNHVYDT